VGAAREAKYATGSDGADDAQPGEDA